MANVRRNDKLIAVPKTLEKQNLRTEQTVMTANDGNDYYVNILLENFTGTAISLNAH